MSFAGSLPTLPPPLLRYSVHLLLSRSAITQQRAPSLNPQATSGAHISHNGCGNICVIGWTGGGLRLEDQGCGWGERSGDGLDAISLRDDDADGGVEYCPPPLWSNGRLESSSPSMYPIHLPHLPLPLDFLPVLQILITPSPPVSLLFPTFPLTSYPSPRYSSPSATSSAFLIPIVRNWECDMDLFGWRWDRLRMLGPWSSLEWERRGAAAAVLI